MTQCAKIAAGLPRKSIRDVGARLRLLALDPLATAQPARPGTARHAALEKSTAAIYYNKTWPSSARCAKIYTKYN